MKDFIRLLTKKPALISVPVKEYAQSFILQSIAGLRIGDMPVAGGDFCQDGKD